MREVAIVAEQSIPMFLVRAALAEDVVEAQVLLYAGCVKVNFRFVNAQALVRVGDRISRAALAEPANTIWRVGNFETVVAVPSGGRADPHWRDERDQLGGTDGLDGPDRDSVNVDADYRRFGQSDLRQPGKIALRGRSSNRR